MARTALALAAAAVAVLCLAMPTAARRAQFKEAEGMLTRVLHSTSADGGSNTTATVYLRLRGRRLRIEMDVEGAAPNLPHAQHIHGSLDPAFQASCPGEDARDGTDDDDLISTLEGAPAYGAILISLTTKGDTSPDSALAVSRFPIADENGRYSYKRNIKVSAAVARKLVDLHIVVHGIDINDNGVYDFDAGASNLDNDLPFEATIPTACGGFELATRRRAAKKIEFDLQPVPHGNRKDGGSAVTGTANVKARGNRLFITMTVEGATPGLPHLQHFHGSLDPGANNSCPDASARNLITDDGLISTAEGAPAYGGILLSLTTEGDMSPDSALDLERFPVADENGRYEYRRIMRVSPEIAQHIENLHLVVHGIDLNGNGEYDFSAGVSSVADDVPLETAVPAACGGAELTRLSKKLVADLGRIAHDEDADGGSDARGTVRMSLLNRRLTVSMDVFNAAPNLPHAQHIHGFTTPGDVGMCPEADARDATDDDGLISTLEGAPAYGGILLSLTTEGDSTPDSALAVGRFPIADETGHYSFERTFTVSEYMAQNIENMHVVVHGIDLNDNSIYDFDAGASNLDEDVPFEATIPTACGELEFAERDRTYKTLVVPLNAVPHDESVDGGSNVTGVVDLNLKGNRLRVKMSVEGAAPGLPHLQHIHGSLDPGVNNSCPTADARDGMTDDGLISLVEGLPFYGGIQLSLTKRGPSSPASGLVLKRFPVADESGRYNYRRVFRVSDSLAERLQHLHVVVHGIDINDNGEYDFLSGVSSVSDDIPMETTIPAACSGLAFEDV